MSKSPNKHYHLYFEARPLEEGLAEAIDDGHIGPRDDPKVRSKVLAEEFGWDMDLTKKIWCFGALGQRPLAPTRWWTCVRESST
jgi:elongation factor 2